MGHVRLGTLPRSKKWRDVVSLLEAGSSVQAVAEAAAKASEHDLSRASKDPRFQFVTSLLVRLPFLARGPGFEDNLSELGIRSKPVGVKLKLSDCTIDLLRACRTVRLTCLRLRHWSAELMPQSAEAGPMTRRWARTGTAASLSTCPSGTENFGTRM